MKSVKGDQSRGGNQLSRFHQGQADTKAQAKEQAGLALRAVPNHTREHGTLRPRDISRVRAGSHPAGMPPRCDHEHSAKARRALPACLHSRSWHLGPRETLLSRGRARSAPMNHSPVVLLRFQNLWLRQEDQEDPWPGSFSPPSCLCVSLRLPDTKQLSR